MAPKSAIVSALLNSASEVPLEARKMVAAGLPTALAATKDERHPFQAAIAEQAKEILQGMLQQAKASSQEKAQIAATKAGETGTLTAAVTAAAEEVSVTAAAVEAAKGKVATSKAARDEVQKDVDVAEAARAKVDREQEKTRKDEQKFEEFSTLYKACLEGLCENDKEAEKNAKKVAAFLGKLGAEQALLVSIPAVLGIAPGDRKGFDPVVIESCQEIVAEKTSALATKKAEAKEQIKESMTTVNEASALLEGAQAVLDGDEAALKAAKADHTAKQTALKAAKAAEASGKVDSETASADAETAKFEEEHLQEVLAQLDTAINRMPVVEEPPAAEEVAAGAAAAAAEPAAAEPAPMDTA